MLSLLLILLCCLERVRVAVRSPAVGCVAPRACVQLQEYFKVKRAGWPVPRLSGIDP